MSNDLDPKWARYGIQSIIVHLNNALEPHMSVQIEGWQRPKKEVQPRAEIRIDGPDYENPSGGFWKLTFELNIALTSVRNDTDLYDHTRLQGIVTAALANNIPVLRYGDDLSMIDCLQLVDRLIVTKFDIVGDRMEGTTVEGIYELEIQT